MKYDYKVVYMDEAEKNKNVLIVDCSGFNELLDKLKGYLPEFEFNHVINITCLRIQHL